MLPREGALRPPPPTWGRAIWEGLFLAVWVPQGRERASGEWERGLGRTGRWRRGKVGLDQELRASPAASIWQDVFPGGGRCEARPPLCCLGVALGLPSAGLLLGQLASASAGPGPELLCLAVRSPQVLLLRVASSEEDYFPLPVILGAAKRPSGHPRNRCLF